jgi:glycerophosphoryl diester phosphodiesterase
MPSPAAELIAHRGASFDAPENTIASIQLAWKQQADAVEIDVQFSKDNHLVVIHDDDTRRTGGLRKKVAAQTLAELQSLDVGRWKDPRWVGERLASLRDAFAAIPAGKRLFVEVKCGPECIPRFAEDFRGSGLKPEQVVPIGFSLETMRRLKQALPELQVCWVVEFKRALQGWTPTTAELITQTKGAGLQGLDVSGRGPVDEALVRQVHDAGLKLYIWTVDDPALARRLRAAGVDGLTTNKPGWLREQLAGP